MADIDLRRGSLVSVKGRKARIERIDSLDTLVLRWSDTRAIESVQRSDIDRADSDKFEKLTQANASLEQIEEAARWQKALQPIIDAGRARADLVAQAATELQVDRATIFRRLKRYRMNDGVSLDLLPVGGQGGPGITRLKPDVEAILTDVIQKHYLKRKSPSVAASYDELKIRCRNAGLEAMTPHYNTFLNRINALPRWERVASRDGFATARDKMKPIRGKYPGGDRPLHHIQIDHCFCDIELVDDIHRMPIGRPWLTLAIDVYSRMVVGFFLSFDSPSASSAGMCLINAMLPKETFLAELRLQYSWPVWGKPGVILADNAKEFRGEMLKSACRIYGIEPRFRPVRTPKYGGHIERLIGTAAGWLKQLPGATYSSPKERGDRNASDTAAMTLRGFERWLVLNFIGRYHEEMHSELGQSPRAQWESFFFGPKGQKEELPAYIKDERRLRLAFTPFKGRTVQRYGLQIDRIHYMSDAIRHLIPMPGEAARTYKVHMDPRDISKAWLYEPEADEYFEVPYRDQTRPAISKWEAKAAIRYLEERSLPVDEAAIFDAHHQLEKIVSEEVESTRKAKQSRRRMARAKDHQERKRIPEALSKPSNDLGAQAEQSQPENVVRLPRRLKPFPTRF